MSLYIFVFIIFGLYYLYAFITEKETERQRKDDPKRKEMLEFYTTQSNLFNLYKNYLYENIEYFKSITDRESIRKKIEKDFPNYGKGIKNGGIIYDFSHYRLLDILDNEFSSIFKTELGETFQIISIAYKNFSAFLKDLYNSGYKLNYCEGNYYSNFGDDITCKIFKINLDKNIELLFGVSSGGYTLDKYLKNHNMRTEEDEMYLFSEIKVLKENTNLFPHFEIIELRQDLSKNEYHNYFNKCMEIGEKFVN